MFMFMFMFCSCTVHRTTYIRLTGEFFTKKAIFLVSTATQHVDDYYIKNRSPLVIFTGIKQFTKNDLHKITKQRKKPQ